MIGYFPAPYPDELMYSWLARYAVKAGYPGYIGVARDLFENPWERPRALFLNRYTADAADHLTEYGSMRELVMGHTMFPYYGRFLTAERKQKVLEVLTEIQGDCYHLLQGPTNNSKGNNLRFCTLCSREDRDKYGETYWHRIHQLAGTTVCPIHGCVLLETKAMIADSRPSLVAAETMVAQAESVEYKDQLEWRLSRYEMEVFMEELKVNQSVDIEKFFSFQLSGTPYISARGKRKDMTMMFSDLSAFYRGIENNWIHKKWRLKEIIYGELNSFHSICQIGFFLQIPSKDLAAMRIDDIAPEEEFDREVQKMHQAGFSYKEIARHFHTSVYTVSRACNRKPNETHRISGIAYGGPSVRDWQKEDAEMLPKVTEVVRSIWGSKGQKPGRVTEHAVQRRLNLPGGRLKKLPMCMQLIREHRESQEQYWARKVIWAAESILMAEGRLSVNRIQALTHMNRNQIMMCKRCLLAYEGSVTEIVEQLVRLLN